MKIIWDEPKRQENIEKHGLDFADLIFFEWETALISQSHSNRMKAIGYFEDGTAVVVYSILGTEAISIISFRPASMKERSLL
jgi:uncharacterized DUF497 family protein